jgi:hypothetical protein
VDETIVSLHDFHDLLTLETVVQLVAVSILNIIQRQAVSHSRVHEFQHVRLVQNLERKKRQSAEESTATMTWASNAQGERDGQMPCRFQNEY